MTTAITPESGTVEAFAALSDPTRLAILGLLREQDQCVCHFVEKLGLKQSVLSHHTGVLRRAGLVSSYPHPTDRRWVYYRLNRDALAELAGHLNVLISVDDYTTTPAQCDADDPDCC
jgi:ArsR family transcriptional regulator